jgi:hypothetical protein
MSTNVYVGLAATAQNNGTITTATFDQVALTSQVYFGDQAINGGGGAAGSYRADTDFTVDQGSTAAFTSPVSTAGVTDPAPQAVYQTERWGVFTYTIPGLTPGAIYNIRLHFAEMYFNSPGQRQFNVSINGVQVLTNFDVDAAAGGPDQAIVEAFLARADSQGRIVIQFTQGAANVPKISGIQVLRAGGEGSPLFATGLSSQAIAGQPDAFDVATISSSVALSQRDFKADISWGDGSSSNAVVHVTASGSIDILGHHKYAQAGLYVTTVSLYDRADGIREVVQGTASVSAVQEPIAVSVAYYDDEHPNAMVPNPWDGSPNVTFWGGTTDGLFDTGAILIQNTSRRPVVIGPGLYVDHFANGATYRLWDSFIRSGYALQPGQSLILAQTAGRDFDTSDTPIVNSPSQSNRFTPLIHITVNGQAFVYKDAAQVLTAGGFDPGQSEGVSESAPWQTVGQVASPRPLSGAQASAGMDTGTAATTIAQTVAIVGTLRYSAVHAVAAAATAEGAGLLAETALVTSAPSPLPVASPTRIAPIAPAGQPKPAPIVAAAPLRAVSVALSLTRPRVRAPRPAAFTSLSLCRSIVHDPAALDELAEGVLEQSGGTGSRSQDCG